MGRPQLAMLMLFALPAFSAVNLRASAKHALQATTGAVQGQVTDSAGAAISGAKVSLSNSATNYKSTTQTDDSGTFRFFNIPFHEYKVRVESEGFLPAEQSVDIHSAVP